MLPTTDYRRTHIIEPDKLHQGLDGVVNGWVGAYRRSMARNVALQQQADRISDMADQLRQVSDRILRERLHTHRLRFRRQEKDYEEQLDDALACMVEVAVRTVGLRPYPVQILGALALYRGYLAEMATGEGKSLTACLPAILAGWTGRPCHIVTVNDYLADRDAHEMRRLYRFCGVTPGCVTSTMDPQERADNYSKDVVYTTSKELVADFLRDRLQLGPLQHPSRRLIRYLLQPRLARQAGLVMRGMDTAIVDEADSVLIDEAVTPLIISRPRENKPLVEACRYAYQIAGALSPGDDYQTDLKYREIRLKDSASEKIEGLAENLPGLWRGTARREELVRQALNAREFYQRDRQYVVEEDKVVIVDEFTGRLMPNRTWRHGLHQAVEAKEGLEPSAPSETLARLSFQRFFRFFRKLSGMTGTAQDAADEFWHIYGLPVLTIPTNRPCIRKQLPDAVAMDTERKWQAVVDEVERIHQSGRPILVGTRNVRASERLAARLDEKGLAYNLLNAVRHREEAQIVAAAGQRGRITIATNMAGRGTDIKLGRGIADMGGLHVIATERHESKRIDRQLFGRCARQGDPGSSQAFVSPEDELIRRFVPDWMQQRLKAAMIKEMPAAGRLTQAAMAIAQRAAQRMAFRQRRSVLQTDTWLEEALSFTGSGMNF